MSRDERYFHKARQTAMLSEFSRARIGCVAVYNNKIIALGINSYKTHPVQKIYDRYRDLKIGNGCPAHLHALHAEIDCLLSIDDGTIDMSKVELYIYRILKNGKMAMSRPCPACKRYIIDRGIRKVHYTTADSYIEENYRGS